MRIRRGTPADAEACARIVHSWVDRTAWMPDPMPYGTLVDIMQQGIPVREFWVAGDPVEGYLSFNPDESLIVGLYTSNPGSGTGKALVDRVKEGRTRLHLWTHAPNTRAHAFYEREGFVKSGVTRDGDDGLLELRMDWEA
ncbi:GNAT family N-acetyltransferase [Pacificoceanicola onchidii]|uniref:GNAT family N-acetyltransferase n=1 Tax=Pacificoceanicola onchidii TaxID=2562685 RepID=UPI0010A444AA|nr:GNAT family N-acetyltransferase [Pacificoceanicola onchidii]